MTTVNFLAVEAEHPEYGMFTVEFDQLPNDETVWIVNWEDSVFEVEEDELKREIVEEYASEELRKERGESLEIIVPDL